MTASEIAEALRCHSNGCLCGRATGDEYKTHCPVHEDTRPSLSLTDKDGTVLVVCFAGCDQNDVVEALQDQGLWAGGRGCTLEELAAAKKLSLSFLKGLGWQDSKWHDTPSVAIPYLASDGTTLFLRHRIGLTGQDRFRQPKGVKLSAFGMNRLSEARHENMILIVEGETDAATAWMNGFACLSLPGAGAWKASYTGLIERVETIFVIREPDNGGDTLVEKVGASLPAVRVIEFGAEIKDINGLWLHVDGDRSRFRAELKKAMARAAPISEIRSGEEREEAVEALAAVGDIEDDILGSLEKAIGKAGYAGDARPPVLIWITQMSRLLEKPLNICLVSPSAAGKNHAIDSGLAFNHPGGYYSVKASSPRALVYNEESFEHRMIVMAEADSIPDDSPAASAVRSLIEDAEMTYEVVEKDDSGQHIVRRIVKPGPTGIITTAIKPLAEQMWTRVLEVGVSDTQDQTRKVLAAHAASVNGDRPAPVAAPFIALDRWLELAGERRVTVPFAARLAELVPANLVRMRRDFRQLLTVIQTIALVHQRQRSRDDGRIVANSDDYEHARWLLEDIFTAVASGGVSKAVREAVVAAGKLYARNKQQSVSVRAVGDYLNLSQDAAWKRVQRAVDLGYLENLQTKERRPAKLIPGDDLPTEKSALPTVKELFPEDDGGLAHSRRSIRRSAETADSDTKSANNEGQNASPPSLSGGSTPPTLPFMEEHVTPVLDGTKTQTTRTARSRMKVGDIIKAKRGKKVFAELEIMDIYEKRLGDFDKDDAQREGGYTLEGFKDVWRRIFRKNGWQEDRSFWVIRFRIAEGGRGVRRHRKTKADWRSLQDSISEPLSEGENALENAVGNAMDKRTLPEPTYRRGSTEVTRMFRLAEARAWPAVSLGEWVIAGKTVRVTVAGTRMAWEEAAVELPVELAVAAIEWLESMSA